jgi:hypothetical protein
MASLFTAFKGVEGFEQNGLPSATHRNYINASNKKYGPLNDLTLPYQTHNLIMPANGEDPQTRVNKAFNTSEGFMDARRGTQYPINYRNDIIEAAKKCETMGAGSSAIFSKAGYEKCGVCFKDGVNHEGKPHIGGQYIYNNKPLQACAPGYFAKTAAEFDRISRKVECETKQSFDVAGCAQCYDGMDNKFFPLDNPSAQESGSVVLTGKGQADVYVKGQKINSAPITLSATEQSIRLSSAKETDSIAINVRGDDDIFIGGYLTGPTKQGKASIDLARIVYSDQETGQKPRIRSQNAGVTMMGPGASKTAIMLMFNVPFTFLSFADNATDNCPAAPFIMKKASATALNSHPCFSEGNAPGQYSAECLNLLYENAGCSPKGGLNPASEQGQRSLNAAGDMNKIIGLLTSMSKKGLTGKDENNTPLAISDWNEASMACYGRQITTPCDAPSLTDDCIKYMYYNSNTYSQKDAATLKGKDMIYCTDKGSAAPNDAASVTAARAAGGNTKDGIKAYFDKIHRTVYDSSRPDADRSQAMMQCYGTTTMLEDDTIPKPVGTLARYVMLKRNPKPGMYLQISKLEVIDRTGKDVAIGKAVKASPAWDIHGPEKPVNGREDRLYWNFYHSQESDQASAVNDYWMVDLGEIKDICYIYYHNRMDYYQERSDGVQVTLLDGANKVVANKVLGKGFLQRLDFIKGEYANNGEIVKRILLSYDGCVSLTAYDPVLKHKFYLSYLQKNVSKAKNEYEMGYNDYDNVKLSAIPSSFRIKYEIDVDGRQKDVVRLQPVGKPDHVVRQRGNQLYLYKYTNADEITNKTGFNVSNQIKKESTFRIIHGVVPGSIRLQSMTNPALYACIGKWWQYDSDFNKYTIFLANPSNASEVGPMKNRIVFDWAVEAPFTKTATGMETYLVSYRDSELDKDRAKIYCDNLGGRLATKQELQQVKNDGGQWCMPGHVQEGIGYPVQQDGLCGKPGINFTPGGGRSNAICHGSKPSPDYVSAAPIKSEGIFGAGQRIWSGIDG